MFELNPHNRLIIYQMMKEYIQEDIKINNLSFGLCFYMTKTVINVTPPSDYNVYNDKFKMFPEIYSKTPTQYYEYWFPMTYSGHAKRIEVLDNAIKEVRRLLNE